MTVSSPRMASIGEQVVQFLTARGWQAHAVQAGSERDARLTFKGKGATLELDHRPSRKAMWLWIQGSGDKRCLGLPYGSSLNEVLAKVVEMQDQFSLAGYLGQYLALQKVCPVTIMAWEQFGEQDGGGFDQGRAVSQAQAAAQSIAAGDGGDADPVVFPGQPVARLSDYVGIMKRMQKGDMMGALAAHGLDMMKWGQVATEWGVKMAADPVLTAKFAKLMQG